MSAKAAKTPCPADLERNKSAISKVTLWGLLANIALSVIKYIVGLAGGSQALIADALHSVSDTATDIIILVGARYWSAPADEDHPHGHGRIETVIGFLIGLAIAAAACGIAYDALSSLQQHEPKSPGLIVFGAACLSLLVKEFLFQITVRVAKKAHSRAVLANAWHHRSDAASSLIVAVAVFGAWLFPSWSLLDHVAAVVVCIFILKVAWDIATPAFMQLIDTGASEHDREQILTLAMSVEGVREVHAIRTRNIGSGMQVDLHVQVDPELSVLRGHAIAGEVKSHILKQISDVVDVLVHLEPFQG